ncbi:MAG: hybrid sensor histidine kinase/response regulator [Vicinamibacterales bacterium]
MSTPLLLHLDSDHAARARRSLILRDPRHDLLEADDTASLPQLIDQHQPALVIVAAPVESIEWGLSHEAPGAGALSLVLFLDDDPMARARALREGADAALPRSATPDELRATVTALVRRHETDAALREREHETVSRENARLFHEAQSANQVKDEFLATLSHELRNPLAAIRYALPVIERETLGEAASRAVQVIHRQLDHVSRLVDDLLDVSRLMRGKVQLRRERVELRGILSVGAEGASALLVRGHHHLTLVMADQPIWLNADAARLSQVVTHLLNNAATFTPRGGEIRLESTIDNGDARIVVRDNGAGIPAESLNEIFDLFRQLQRPDTLQGGLGIGLALSKRVVELHGGSIQALSAGPDRGAEFVVRLPLPQQTHDTAEPPDAARSRRSERRLKVLIVDDNIDLVEMLTDVVQSLGHEVDKAFDGVMALDRAGIFHPDVVLLDLGLPLLSGIDVARRLRSRPDTADAKLIAFTGWGQAEDRSRTQAAGFDYHLTKPADLETLAAVLSTLSIS